MNSVQYDIDLIVSTKPSPGSVLFALWEVLLRFQKSQLLPAETILLDGWNFDVAFGNGISNMISAEDFDTIAHGFSSIRELNSSVAADFTDKIKAVFERFSIGCGSGDELALVKALPDDKRIELRKNLDLAEQPFLESFWHKAVLIEALWDYLHRNLDALRSRKPDAGE